MKKQIGKLYLIPNYISTDNDCSFISNMVMDILKHTSYYLVENIRTARRFISSQNLNVKIDSLYFFLLNKNTTWDEIPHLLDPIKEGHDMGIISESGLPCLADPGHLAIRHAHQLGVQIVPLPGGSSVQMALISSGFNGQQFCFNGYLPISSSERVKKIVELERKSQKGCTQIFMETPYRNEKLMESICKHCCEDTLLSVSKNISGKNEYIKTLTIRQWRSQKVDLHKIPTIFIFGNFN